MNTFSKIVSMFLVVVMCFGLFTASAFATDLLAPADVGAEAGNDILNSFGTGGDNGGDLLAGYSYTEPTTVDAFDYSAANTVDTTADVWTDPNANANANTGADDDLAAGINAPAGNDLASVAAAAPVAEDVDILSASMTDTFNSFSASDTMTFEAVPQFVYTRDETPHQDIVVSVYDDDYQYYYTNSKTAISGTLLRLNTDYVVFDKTTKQIQLTQAFLNSMGDGIWYFRAMKFDGSVVPIFSVVVQATNKTTPDAGVDPGVAWPKGHNYNRNDSTKLYLDCSGTSVNFATTYSGFAYSPNDVWASPMNSINGSSYYIDGSRLYLRESFLQNLNDGTYYLWGYKKDAYGNFTTKHNLGYFTISNGNFNTNWSLTPDGQVWYSGTDPLTFYCDIFDAAGKDWNYAGYDWDVIIPDIRVSTRSNMSGAVSVRIDQYWDLGYGYFMLGQNFLNSLSAEETYYMQVVDARHPDIIYSNTVQFRVGPTLRAIDTDKHVINSTRSLRFRSSGDVSAVYVGNIQLTDPADFGVSWDGKTVTLSYEFLNKRSPGNTYTIKVRTTGGEYASTTFQVLTTAQGSASPRTGDESNLGLWAAFLLLSGTAVVVLIPKLRKQDF